ncbi:class I SAM-dependent methyltransferase [Nocardia abscessus]|uniref:class I SAM-dependent methyltransferase n=1 Tax=Nocardia TaxID=1817 RepID=UPI0018940FA4|nr:MULTISPECIES: class I SAM-dependent methyltransferase [Nocardia]MBF6221165.1 class I SAM-dependent methyltransferase [Nocardia abscessus]MDE1671241.1 class I SAM-dependent methyltransferase [Nocardia gipuzkoensis]
MRTSLIYRNGTVYEVLMRGLYGKHYTARYRAIAELVPQGASVVDLCCGPATLYTRYLRHKSVDYTGLDLNERFVARVNEAGGRGEVWNLRAEDALPTADYVIMQASLYHFLPEPQPLIDRMLAAANRQVIVAEPIRNLATSDNPLLATIGKRFTDAGDGEQAHRFTERTLDVLFTAYQPRVARQSLIAGGREKLYVLTA